MPDGYLRLALADVDREQGRPTARWPISPDLGLSDYSRTVARLEPGERLSTNAYHYHDDQEAFFYVVEGTGRDETDDVNSHEGGRPLQMVPPQEALLAKRFSDEGEVRSVAE